MEGGHLGLVMAKLAHINVNVVGASSRAHMAKDMERGGEVYCGAYCPKLERVQRRGRTGQLDYELQTPFGFSVHVTVKTSSKRNTSSFVFKRVGTLLRAIVWFKTQGDVLKF